ncbi:D-alanyl-D-alanine carboxypeptidase family protein [Enterovirga rhinocerotis]|uniref:D-alanyl-D-alanine carboxypeptidase n=1 Tax=Enterovirga rhinocerotis TaxID=1339210 RepID=A0A4V6PZI7_9HYPH|nr:D-alanyl-D-alanine carboxypeptidase family protein [Enterovirga rhinocerotis]TDR89559.1 D-alanyl-D-alanine carboxypeptidase [Enterovirga rhinocerotis]
MRARPRALIATALALAVGAFGTASAQTPSLVVDAASGRVLHAERATDPWYPASVTKLMTVYVALDQVRSGRLRMNSLLTMSERAAAMPPSKIGLRPGLTLTLENALKIIMVKSANDVATMIGENVGGSMEGFAAMMNQASRRLGMNESRWYNPSGLPDNRQVTSARDMAILARALLREFPDRQDLFSIGAVQLGSVVMRNHNGLLGRYPGADGMKTGFICSGGFNIVASAQQGGRRLITVVMGHASSKERDLRAAQLFDANFSSSGWGAGTLETLPLSASMAAPDMRPVVCGPKRRQPAEEEDNVASSDNPLAAMFASAAPRRTLGPRVAFAPTPVWVGAQPGGNDDEALTKGRGRSQLARRNGRSRVATPTPASRPGPAAMAFTSSSATPSIIAGKPRLPPRGAARASADATVADTKRKANAAGAVLPPQRRAAAATAKPTPAVQGTNPAARTASRKPAPAKKSAAAKAD